MEEAMKLFLCQEPQQINVYIITDWFGFVL